MELASLDIRYAVRELSQLAGAKVEKIFQSDVNKRDVLFILYLQEHPKLRFLLPGIVCTPKEKAVYPQQPPGFAMFLRKHLGGARLAGVRQRGFDRIVELDFSTKAGTLTLIIEFMAPGNMLLVDSEGRILNLLENQQYKDRQLRARQPYAAPPAPLDLPSLSDDELAQRITVSTKNQLVVTLAVNCQLGGVYAEEVCARAGIAKHRNDLSAEEVRVVVRAVREILDRPILAHADESRAYPFELHSREAKPCAESSFLAALSQFAPEEPMIGKVEARARERASPQTKLQAIIDAQGAQAKRLEAEIVLTQRKGERLYEEYALVDEILAAAREARAKKQPVAEALARFPQVKAFRPETGELELELEDEA